MHRQSSSERSRWTPLNEYADAPIFFYFHDRSWPAASTLAQVRRAADNASSARSCASLYFDSTLVIALKHALRIFTATRPARRLLFFKRYRVGVHNPVSQQRKPGRATPLLR